MKENCKSAQDTNAIFIIHFKKQEKFNLNFNPQQYMFLTDVNRQRT